MKFKDYMMNVIKQYGWLRAIYSSVGSVLLKTIGVFVKTDNRLILFNSFGGKKYDDSPKEIYEAMRSDDRFRGYKFVWAFHKPEQFDIPGASIIKTDNLKYFLTAIKATCWVTNSSIERGLSFKKRNTIYVNTWHGTPLKKMGNDQIASGRKLCYKFDLQCAQSEYEAKIFSKAFNIPLDKFLISGLPRNDILANITDSFSRQIKGKIGLPRDKKVILYAPTFREYERDEKHNCVLRPPVDFNTWKRVLGEDFIVLLRLHYEVKKALVDSIDGYFVRDVSDYPRLNDLMISSDLLVTDYSSIMFDYSILNKPIFIYAYDFDEYNKKRGMYFDVRKDLPGEIEENKLLHLIKKYDDEDNIKKVAQFRKKYVTAYGNATTDTLNAIYEMLKNKGK